MFLLCKKQLGPRLFFVVFIWLKTFPCMAVFPCQADFIENNQNIDEERLLNQAEEAEQLMENAREILDKIKYMEEQGFLSGEEIENHSSLLSSEPPDLEEIRKAKRFFSYAYKKFKTMANAFLNQATEARHSALQNLEKEFDNVTRIFNKKSSHWEKKINELLINTADSHNKMNTSDGTHLSLDDLIEDMSLLRANTPYLVTVSNNDKPVFVFFDESIVNIFLDPKQTAFHFDLFKKNLSSIKKGFTVGFGITGLKLLGRDGHRYRGIFEIKTIGRVAGNVRLGGFKDKQGNLHIVHHTKGSEHTPSRMNSFVHRIISKRNSAKEEASQKM